MNNIIFTMIGSLACAPMLASYMVASSNASGNLVVMTSDILCELESVRLAAMQESPRYDPATAPEPAECPLPTPAIK